MIKLYTYLLLLMSAVLLSACEVIVPKQYEAEEQVVLEKYKDVPLKDVMRDVQKKFDTAKNQALYFYSPNNYRTARTGVQAARAYFRDPEKKTYVLTSLYRADQALEDGFEVKVIVEREMKEPIKLRDTLDILDAKKTHTREYRSLMTSLSSLIEVIESKKEELFKDQASRADFEERKKDIQVDLEDFRLRVVKFKFLNHGELLVSESEAYDAKTIAPQTYAEAIKSRNDALTYINNNIENLDGINDAAKVFQFAAQRLMHITREVHNVMNLEPNTHENYVLRQEQNLVNLAKELKLGDIRNQTFSAQTTQLVAAIKRVSKEKEQNALKIAELSSDSGSADSSVSAVDSMQAEQSAVANETEARPGADNKSQGVAIVPISGENGGDPEQLKKSLRILTDQVYQLTIEKNSWESQRAQLNTKIKQLQAQLNEKKAAAKPKQGKADKKSDTENKPAETKPSESKPAEQKSPPAESTLPAEKK